MRKCMLIAVTGILLMAPLASAQMADQPVQLGPTNMSRDGAGQDMTTVSGKITAVDLARGTLTLNNITEISLPPSFQYTSLPAIDQQVDVTYDLQDGHKVARSIDLDAGGDIQGK